MTAFTAVAEDESGIVGMVSAHERPNAVEIVRLYVLRGAQRRWIGGRLLAAALATFPTRMLARLRVEEQNPKGTSVLHQGGFVAVCERMIEAFETNLRLIVMERNVGVVGDHTID